MKFYRSLFIAIGLLAAGHLAMAGGRLDGKEKDKDALPRQEQRGPMVQGAEAAAPFQMVEEGQGVVLREQDQSSKSTSQSKAIKQDKEAQSNEFDGPQDLKMERMSRAEKKAMKDRFRANRKDLRKKMKAERAKRDNSEKPGGDTELLLLVIVAILLPPLAVGLYEGITTNFWIDLLLTLLFYIPGLIFALVVILR